MFSFVFVTASEKGDTRCGTKENRNNTLWGRYHYWSGTDRGRKGSMDTFGFQFTHNSCFTEMLQQTLNLTVLHKFLSKLYKLYVYCYLECHFYMKMAYGSSSNKFYYNVTLRLQLIYTNFLRCNSKNSIERSGGWASEKSKSTPTPEFVELRFWNAFM